MKTVSVSEIIRTAQLVDTKYVLASEAQAEVDKANADWVERCRKFREQDAKEAAERIKVLEDALKSVEWSGYDDYMQANCCPICRADSRTSWKHKADCQIGKALEVNRE